MPNHDAIRAALGRGDCLVAYDLAVRAANADVNDLDARYLAVLALARAGATERATEELAAFGLEPAEAVAASPTLREDIGALCARLAKDHALAAAGEERRQRARVAAERYEETYRALGRPYACINAATMWLLAGNDARSAALARDAVRLSTDPTTAGDPYWAAATVSEARLLLGDSAGASAALHRAAGYGPDIAARATTRHQLRLVCELTGAAVALLDALAVPRVTHYTGHRAAPDGEPGRLHADDEERVAGEVAAWIDARAIGIGYGALACGADIIVAEALLARGAELHVVLPFARDEFVDVSVRTGGEAWVPRFARCLDAATSVSYATHGSYLGAPELFSFGSAVAMGQALIRASYLSTEAEQLAIWDGRPTDQAAGTAVDVEVWQRNHHPTHVVEVAPPAAPVRAAPAPAPDPDPAQAYPPRRVRALLFADVQGYSRLGEAQVLAFVEAVLAPLGAAIDRFGADVLHRNTWGDGLYVVFRDTTTAAECALALQQTMREIDLDAHRLPDHLALRIGAHAGPVFEQDDPITGHPGFFGAEVTRTARIEPGTPAGDVYVTDPFAALVVLEGRAAVSCQYVGPVPTAKGYGTLPLYTLRRR